MRTSIIFLHNWAEFWKKSAADFWKNSFWSKTIFYHFHPNIVIFFGFFSELRAFISLIWCFFDWIWCFDRVLQRVFRQKVMLSQAGINPGSSCLAFHRSTDWATGTWWWKSLKKSYLYLNFSFFDRKWTKKKKKKKLAFNSSATRTEDQQRPFLIKYGSPNIWIDQK